MNEFVIINNLSPALLETYGKDNLPLHVTLVHTFYSDEKSEVFAEKLKTISKSYKSFSVSARSREIFGDRELSVTELTKTDTLQRLHSDIVNSLKDLVRFKNPLHINENYRPHVTDQLDDRIEVGEVVAIESFTLLQIIGEDLIVKANFELGK